jgi:hypothetical protein
MACYLFTILPLGQQILIIIGLIIFGTILFDLINMLRVKGCFQDSMKIPTILWLHNSYIWPN